MVTAGSQTLRVTDPSTWMPTVSTTTATANTTQAISRKGSWVANSSRAMLQTWSSVWSLIVILPTAR
jgi:hypothetical protein